MRRPVGVKWVLLFFVGQRFISPAGFAAVAMLPSALSEERLVSLGACWAFLVQPALPSVWRPVVLLLESRTWARPLTQSPELGFGLLSFLFLERFCFYAAAATVVGLLLCNGLYTSPLTHR